MTVNIQNNMEAIKNEKFNWLSSQNTSTTRIRSQSDITITEVGPCSHSGKSNRYNITLRNEVPDKLGTYVDLALFKNRIFFRPSSAEANGYKMYNRNHTNGSGNEVKGNPFIQVTKTESTKALSDFVGHYELKYDEFYELYYIEKPM